MSGPAPHNRQPTRREEAPGLTSSRMSGESWLVWSLSLDDELVRAQAAETRSPGGLASGASAVRLLAPKRQDLTRWGDYPGLAGPPTSLRLRCSKKKKPAGVTKPGFEELECAAVVRGSGVPRF